MRHRVACLAVLLLAATCLVLAQVDEGLAARDRERAWANLKASKIARQHRITSWNLPEGYQLPSGKLTGPRPPGTLLLNMLIKNEREHLDRTLPKWAKIIDCWIIGVDDANTDDSPEVIMKHLGHIPGKIMTVHFDGMGPTWTELVKEGKISWTLSTLCSSLVRVVLQYLVHNISASVLDLFCVSPFTLHLFPFTHPLSIIIIIFATSSCHRRRCLPPVHPRYHRRCRLCPHARHHG